MHELLEDVGQKRDIVRSKGVGKGQNVNCYVEKLSALGMKRGKYRHGMLHVVRVRSMSGEALQDLLFSRVSPDQKQTVAVYLYSSHCCRYSKFMLLLFQRLLLLVKHPRHRPLRHSQYPGAFSV